MNYNEAAFLHQLLATVRHGLSVDESDSVFDAYNDLDANPLEMTPGNTDVKGHEAGAILLAKGVASEIEGPYQGEQPGTVVKSHSDGGHFERAHETEEAASEPNPLTAQLD